MRLAAIVALGLAAAGPASASAKWTAAGWYLIADAQVREWIDQGPFNSDDACSALLSRKADLARGAVAYSCEFLNNPPLWD